MSRFGQGCLISPRQHRTAFSTLSERLAATTSRNDERQLRYQNWGNLHNIEGRLIGVSIT
jgi:hypothetical protein